ncbi:hypothetical protein [Parasitella parasitica]|nr:hypothetical protein [Parasitella parasitica]
MSEKDMLVIWQNFLWAVEDLKAIRKDFSDIEIYRLCYAHHAAKYFRHEELSFQNYSSFPGMNIHCRVACDWLTMMEIDYKLIHARPSPEIMYFYIDVTDRQERSLRPCLIAFSAFIKSFEEGIKLKTLLSPLKGTVSAEKADEIRLKYNLLEQ